MLKPTWEGPEESTRQMGMGVGREQAKTKEGGSIPGQPPGVQKRWDMK